MSQSPSTGSQPGQPKRVARWRYVVPNAVTCGSLLVGLAAFKFAVVGDFMESAWLIILCVVLDKADGTAARILKATSTIGAQLDSFADFVSFGIAPAALVFSLIRGFPPDAGVGPYAAWHTETMSYLNHILASAFVLCAAIRLAKFNVITDVARDSTGTTVFYGLPSTMAGAIVASAVIVGVKHEMTGFIVSMPAILAGLGLMMVLNFPMPKVSKRKSMVVNIFVALSAFTMITAGIIRCYPEYLLVMLVLFTSWGIGWGVVYGKTLERKSLDPYEDAAE